MSKKQKIAPLPAQKHSELVGLLIVALTLLALMSFISFSYSSAKTNWLGAIGFTISWIMHTFFGILSYPLFVASFWVGYRTLLQKEIIHFKWRLLALITAIFSLGMLLTTLEKTFFGEILLALFYPDSARSDLPYHLAGLPFYALYKGLPHINLLRILNAPGVTLLFSLTFSISLLFLFNISLSNLIQLFKQSTVKKEKPPELIPVAPLPMPIMPKIQVVEQIEQEPILPVSKPKVEKRERALSQQRVWNGDFKEYKLPSLNLLTPAKKFDQSLLKKELMQLAKVLEDTLQNFNIIAKVGQIHCGPTITSFEVHPAVGVKVQKIKALENDIALNMQAASIRIIAPIPGKACVGVEVPNSSPQEVSFREMMAHYQKQEKPFKVPLLLGKGVNGEWVMSDLTKMPHLIIAGATGSGKSVCINAIIMSILYTARPDEIQFIMVDPKKVELTPYSHLPHMIAPVITSPHEAYTAMQWLVKEMEKRYEICNRLHVRNIDAFNSRTIDREKEKELPMEIPEKMPYIVGIIDELADLMMSSTYDIETPIARIAQMARAVGIHLILATQRPSREVITGLIKANFPTRICFKVSSGINSKIVIDSTGGEQLLGNGDMLFLPPGTSNLERVQGAFLRDQDIHSIIQSITEQAPTNYRIPSFANVSTSSEQDLFDPPGNDKDVLYNQALDIVISTGNASTTFLQRKLKIGYARAASLMDQLESNGVVSPPDGSKARTVLLKGEKK